MNFFFIFVTFFAIVRFDCMTTFYFHSLSDTGESMSKAVCQFRERLWTKFGDPDRGLVIPQA